MGQRSRLCCLNWVAKQIGSKFKCDKNQHENAAGTPKAVWEQEQLKSASSGCFLAWLPLTPHCPPGSRSYCIENLNISILIDKLSMMLAQSSDLGQHTSSLLWLCAHTKCYCKLWEFSMPPVQLPLLLPFPFNLASYMWWNRSMLREKHSWSELQMAKGFNCLAVAAKCFWKLWKMYKMSMCVPLCVCVCVCT